MEFLQNVHRLLFVDVPDVDVVYGTSVLRRHFDNINLTITFEVLDFSFSIMWHYYLRVSGVRLLFTWRIIRKRLAAAAGVMLP